MPKYGLISETDANTIEKTIDLICNEFSEDYISITEIGLFNCETSAGIMEYLKQKKRGWNYTGIDNEKDKSIVPLESMNFIKGSSNEVYQELEDNSQHMIFFDGCHCFTHVVSDFLNYCTKVKVGGYILFHDTGLQIEPFNGYQHGDNDKCDSYVSVRRALYSVGLLGKHYIYHNSQQGKWQLVFDEADKTDEFGGICVFKKLF